MRRLPIFFVVDGSESMIGESLYEIEMGIATITKTLRAAPYALESTWVSVIAFAGKPKTVTPLTELFAFHPPELPVGGGTELGAALDHLMDEIDRTVQKATPDRKADWKPIIFLLTDGRPTDDVTRAVNRWNTGYRHGANLIAISIGGGADTAILPMMTDDVLVFDDTAPQAYARFINWISQSVQAQSRSVSTRGETRVSLAKCDADLLADRQTKTALVDHDDRCAVFIARCAKWAAPYIVKYERHLNRIETADPALAQMFQTRNFALVMAVPVKNSYFEMSDSQSGAQPVSSADLIGQPACPHCQARFGMAVCA
ncbi:MAG: VWA domain-containing protein [Candidatus Saccharibacteria bacterium]|nr:VWA domain-containing protein [Pseudorhodobacter sp.]